MATVTTENRHFTIQWQEATAIVHLHNAMLYDGQEIAEICRDLLTLVELRQPTYLLVNFGAVSRCSTEMIGTLLRIREAMLAYGGDLRLCGLRETLREGYRILKLDGTAFQIHDTVAAAMEATVGRAAYSDAGVWQSECPQINES